MHGVNFWSDNMKSEFQLIWKYIILMCKNWILWMLLLLDLIGLIISFNKHLNIPNWFIYLIPYAAILIAGYHIFKKSAPKITIDKPLENEYKIEFPYTDSFTYFNISFDSYIRNFGLQTGSLEEIRINLMGVNDINDKFILKNMGISFEKPLICKTKNMFHLLEVDPSKRHGFKFPMVLVPGTMIPIYFRVSMSFSGNHSSSDEILDWIKKVQFELEYKCRNGYKTEIINIPFTFKLNNLQRIKENEEIKMKDFDKMLQDRK